MRKTVDLDDDVNEMLREEVRRTGKTLSAVFNDAIRRASVRDKIRLDDPSFETTDANEDINAVLP